MKKLLAILICLSIAMASIVVAVASSGDDGDEITVLSTETPAVAMTSVTTGNLPRSKVTLSNMTDNSTFGPAPSFITNANRVVVTEKGSYITYMELEDIIKMKRGKQAPALNRFSLHKLTDDGSYSYIVGYGYTWDGDIELLANSVGDVFVMCGYSSFEEHTVLQNHIPDDEKVILSAFFYDIEGDHLVNYGNVRYLEEGYSQIRFVTAAIDHETDKIYSVFTCVNDAGENFLEYFVFDTATLRWEKGSTKIAVPVAPEKAYAYISDGFNMIYEVDGIIRLVNDDVTEIAAGEIHDVYPDTNGNVHMLYLEEGAATYTYTVISGDTTDTADLGIASDKLVTLTERNGELRLLTSLQTSPIQITEYTVVDGVFTSSHRAIISLGRVPNGQFMVSRPSNGSIEAENHTILIATKAGDNIAWCFGLFKAAE